MKKTNKPFVDKAVKLLPTIVSHCADLYRDKLPVVVISIWAGKISDLAGIISILTSILSELLSL